VEVKAPRAMQEKTKKALKRKNKSARPREEQLSKTDAHIDSQSMAEDDSDMTTEDQEPFPTLDEDSHQLKNLNMRKPKQKTKDSTPEREVIHLKKHFKEEKSLEEVVSRFLTNINLDYFSQDEMSLGIVEVKCLQMPQGKGPKAMPTEEKQLKALKTRKPKIRPKEEPEKEPVALKKHFKERSPQGEQVYSFVSLTVFMCLKRMKNFLELWRSMPK